jgi:hypothetical protein
MTLAEAGAVKHRVERPESTLMVTKKIVEQNKQDMICNARAVNRSSNCNPGSQTVWFEKSLPASQRKSPLITAFWRKLVSAGPSPLIG